MPASRHPFVVLAVVLAAGLVPAAAVAKPKPPPSAPVCATPDDMEQPFEDGLNYVLVPGGSFETSLWKRGTRANENEPWFVREGGASDAWSLSVSTSATSPQMCVGLLDPTLRFFARQTDGPVFSTLTVESVFVDNLGNRQRVMIPWLPDATLGGWLRTAPAPIFANLSARPSATGEFGSVPTGTVQFTFTASPGSTWRIDDVFVDPYRRN